MITAVISLLLAASVSLPSSFVAPKGWIAKAMPADAPVDFMWVSPDFGIDGNGENLTLSIAPASVNATLDSEVHTAMGDLSRDRDIVNSHLQPTCHGLLPGWTFEGRLPLPNGNVISQVYHLTILDRGVYTFVFTHAASDRIEPEIRDSIQSLCPGK